MSLMDKEFTVRGVLVAKEVDTMEYTTYVFQCLDKYIKDYTPYIMCVKYPNWCHKEIDIGDEGYLTVREVEAGKDTWYNGEEQIPYMYDTIQFIKFIHIRKKEDNEYKIF